MKILDERREKIERLISDENMRNLVFDFENQRRQFLSDSKKCVQYMSNVITMVTFFVLRRFIEFKKKLSDDEPASRRQKISKFSNSFVRLYNLFDGCYVTNQINFELLENILVNLQIDATVFNNENNFINVLGLNNFFSFTGSDNHLSKYLFAIKKSKLSSRYVSNLTFEDLCIFLQMFPFLSTSKVTCSDYIATPDMDIKEICLSPFDGHDISLRDLMLIINNEVYYLDTFTVSDPRESVKNETKEQKIDATYVHISSRGEYRFCISDIEMPAEEGTVSVVGDTAIEDFFFRNNFISRIGEDKNGNYFFKNYIFFNNRYIRYIAIVLSDLLTTFSKKQILTEFGARYKEVFEKLRFNGGEDAQLWCWDEILIFLLVEVGVYDFLKYLLLNTNLDYEEVMAGFRLRFGDRVDKICESDDVIRNPLYNLRYKNSENKATCYTKALILFATKLLTGNHLRFTLNTSSSAINDVLEDFSSIYSSKEMNDQRKIIYFVGKLVNINNFIVVFYKGLFEYISYKKLEELDKLEGLITDKQSRDSSEMLSQCLSVFSEETRKARKSTYSNYNYLLQIRDTNESFWKEVTNCIEQSFHDLLDLEEMAAKKNTRMNEQLFEILGKYRLFDRKEIINIEHMMLEVFKNRPHNAGNQSRIVQDLYDKCRIYLEYLRDGSNDKSNNIEDSIYPIIGSCTSSVLSQDGYRYSFLKVNHGKDGLKLKVKIISEEDLDPGKVYYCVPNINRCAVMGEKGLRVWISPIIIPYEAYLSTATATFQRLSSKDDYEDVAELLYQTDTQIYKNLFGTIENAKKVLPKMFDNGKNTIFSKTSIYLLKTYDALEDGEVSAVATMYTTLPEWNRSLFENAFNEAEVEIPETANLAFNYFQDTFNDAVGDSYVICELCVKPEKRGRGLGRMLLTELSKLAETNGMKNIIITVYADNFIALNLYHSIGFVPYGIDHDNRGGRNSEKYCKMILYT